VADAEEEVPEVVETAQGAIRGVAEGGLRVFRGIPYAEPPVGELRLRRAVPHPSWEGVLDCTAFRPCALQSVDPGLSIDAAYPGGLDESCLHLNVWTPAAPGADASLPVFVWIHGGGFMVGSGSEPIYEGTRFAEQDVVVVTINYRLGAFGFMWPEGGDPNCGLWDQVRALQWVKENIGEFGGDPRNVTIGGESAGAACSTCLVASPIANKLFQRAIIMSTVAHTTDDERTAKLRAEQFARSLGAASAHVDDLRKFSAQDLLATQAGEHDAAPGQAFMTAHNTPGWQGPNLDRLDPTFSPAEPDGIHYVIPEGSYGSSISHSFFPACDGELLPGHPLDLIAEGKASHISLIVGSNREETGFRTNPRDPHVTAPLTFGARVDSEDDAIKRAHWFFMGWGKLGTRTRRTAEELVAAYAAAEGEAGGAAPAGSIQHVWNRLASDMAFNASTVMVAARQARHRPDETFAYRFDGFGNRNAFHGWELGLVFGTLLNEGNADTNRFAESMRSAFVRFMNTGRPRAADLPPWSAWSISDGLDGPVMHFDRARNQTTGYLEAAPEIGRIVDLLDDAFFHQSSTR